MIERLVMTYLEADATLKALLASVTSIYALEAPEHSASPYLSVSASVGVLDETLDEDRLEIKIVADSVAHLVSIRDRLKTLLDNDNDIRALISDSTYRVFFAKLTGSVGQYNDPDTDEPIDVLFFNFKYVKL